MKNLFDGTISPIVARKVVQTTKKRYEFIVTNMGLKPDQEINDIDLLTVKIVWYYGWEWGPAPTKEYVENNYAGMKKIDWDKLGHSKYDICIKENGELTTHYDILPGYYKYTNFNMICQNVIEELRKFDVHGFNYRDEDLLWWPGASDGVPLKRSEVENFKNNTI